MNSQVIVARANAHHFGHPEAGRGNQAPAHVPSAHASVNHPPAPAEQPAESTDPKTDAKATPAKNVAKRTKKSSPVACVFRYAGPKAREVLLAGEFTDWEKSPLKMVKDLHGVWQTSVTLSRGQHRYRYLVDGTWQEDPNCQDRVPNPFGTFDEVITVT